MAGSVNKVILIGNLGRRSRNPSHPGRPADRQSSAGDIGILEGQDDRRAARKDRMAPRRHLQRKFVPDRRAISQERLEGLHRRRVADAQMAGPVRPRPILDRSGAAGFSRRTDIARSRRRGAAAAGAMPVRARAAANSARPGRRAKSRPPPRPDGAAATWTTRFRSDPSLRPTGPAKRRLDVKLRSDPKRDGSGLLRRVSMRRPVVASEQR